MTVAPIAVEEAAAAEAWYRRALTSPAVLPRLRFEPVRIGPTWQLDGRHWLLPERTLGWQVLGWTGAWLELSARVPWRWTLEQARWLLWWYATDDDGRFLYRDAVLQRLKGWGKDPVGAGVCVVESVGPARVIDLRGGQPVGGEVEQAWVQTAAVSQEQTKNTMRLLPTMLPARAQAAFGAQVGKTTMHARGDTRLIQAVTSSPKTLEGARSTAVLLNETHHWVEANDGHEMAAVVERNSTKSADGAARTIRITNAYDPADDSVAQRDREAYEAVAAGQSAPSGLLYDSLEAPPGAPLTAEDAPEVVRGVRGDSVWLDEDRIVASIVDARNPPSRSRRFWFNQITAAEDAWTTVDEWDACQVVGLELEAGDEIVLLFDGSKADDATGLVGCRMSDGAVFELGCWQRPPKLGREAGWSVPRDEVDAFVDYVHDAYRVRGFWCDPGAGEDDSGMRYWDRYIDGWAARFGSGYDPLAWAARSGPQRHATLWDMRRSSVLEQFTAGCERTLADIEAGQVPHRGDPKLRDHVRNARRRPNRWGVGIGKEHRESARKVDLAVCMVGARTLRRQLQTSGDGKRRRTGRVVGVR